MRSAVNAIKQGAFDYLQKPFDNDELLAIIGRAIEMLTLGRRVKQLEDQLQQTYSFDNIIGISDKMKSTFSRMRRFAAVDGTVLVHGESGTGKELVVHAIHQASRRSKGPFVVVNCGAIPPSLIESEFFGHEAGTFTDAKKRRLGKFEAANGGSIFLDEIGDLPLEAQVKLLRVLEQGSFTRLGSNETVAIDVRVMAATNRDLEVMVEQHHFRGDLYWRLNVLSLHLCPLRERQEDIPLLVDHFLQKFSGLFGGTCPRLSASAMAQLKQYTWPGNVRELQNAIYSALAIAEENVIEVDDLPPTVLGKQAFTPTPPGQSVSEKSLAELAAEATAQCERQAIQDALSKTQGNKEKAAELLGIGRKTLYRKLNQYDML